MLAKIKEFFSNKIDLEKADSPVDPEHAIRMATCALMIEMASVDEEFSEAERKSIADHFKREFSLSDDEINELFELSSKELDNSIDLWGFTNLINTHYDKPQKIKVIEMIWEVVYADKELSAHEDYLIHKFYKMLNLSHSEMIEAKMRALERLEK